MLTPGDEESLLRDIKEGVLHALYLGKQEGRFTEDEIHLDKIRSNKLQYIVNEDRDLGLTFGWFKYGPAPEDVTTEDDLSLQPLPGEDISQLEESRLPSKDYLSTEAFAYYYLSEPGGEFDRIVTADDTKVYLEDFYRQYAPHDESAGKFTDLYIASARCQRILDTIGEDRGWYDDSTEYYYELERRLGTVTDELSKLESLENTIEPMEEYRRLLTSIIAEADSQDALSPAQHALIKHVIRLFYRTIWDFVGQEISLQTMRGENVDELRPNVETAVTKYREGSWQQEITSLESRRSALGLEEDLDDVDDLSPVGNDEDNQSLDEDLVERVSRAGAEVIRE